MRTSPSSLPPFAALSMDAELRRLTQRGRVRGHVHSAFRHVVNVMTERGTLISLCSRSLDDAPWSVRMDVPQWQPADWPVGAAVTVESDGVYTAGPHGRAAVFGDAIEWWPASSDPLPSEGLAGRVATIGALLRERGTGGGALAATGSDSFQQAVAARISECLELIRRGERDDRSPVVDHGVAGMIGLGPGLTPAGDDVLTGLALTAALPSSRIRHLTRSIERGLRRGSARTTTVSETTLREALRGRARESLTTLFAVISAPQDGGRSDDRLANAVDRVLRIGHTSGTDILSGVVAGLRLEIDLRGPRWLSEP